MKKMVLSFAPLFFTIVLLYSSCSNQEDEGGNTNLRFISEEYEPFNYSENSIAVGLAPDLLKEICDKLNIECNIEFLPWEEGYNTTLTTDNTVLFTTAMNSVRKDKFKWVGPIASLDWNFYSINSNSFTFDELDDAKSIGKIGVIADYAIEEYLIQEGFTNLVYCTDVKDALSKLLNEEIDLFPSDKYTTESALVSLGKSPYAVVSQLTIKTDLLYFAFNSNVSDELVADFQETLDLLKNNGTLRELSGKYLHTTDYPDIMQLYTEPYPPLSFRNSNGEITGFGTDIVNELMKRNGLCYNIKLSSWSNDYQLALINPNFCIFTMDRTVIRENLFQWVGPIGTNTTWFFTKKGSDIPVSSLEEAKNLSSIGAVNSWFSTQYLQELGFSNLVLDSDPEALAEKLMKGEINAFVCSDITLSDILEQVGYDYTYVNPSFALMASDYYIGFSLNTSSDIVNQWQITLDEMKLDGTYDAIHGKWLP